MKSLAGELCKRAWWLGFLGLFIPLALPPLLILLFPSLPGPLALAAWLWADFFGSWSGGRSPLEWAVLYTALAVVFAFVVARLRA